MPYDGPMPAEQLLTVLPLVQLSRSQRDLVAIIGAQEGGRWVDAGDAAHEVGLSEGRCRVLLAGLAKTKVILRDSGGRGRRFWCEVNPDVLAWKVEWRVARRELVDRLARHATEVRLGPIRRFIARPMHARCAAANARLWSARSEDDAAAKALVTDAGASTASRGPRSARSGRHLRVVPARAVIDDSQEGVLSGVGFGGGDEEASSQAGGSAEEEESKRIHRRARSAVFARALPAPDGSRWIKGAYRETLERLVLEHGIDVVVDATLRVEAHRYMPPKFIERLEGELDGPIGEDDPAMVADRAQRLDQRVTALRNQRETYLRAGVDPDDEIISVIDQELAECDNQRQARSGEGAG